MVIERGGFMLEYLFGNDRIEKILFYILSYNDCYAKAVADLYKIPLNGVQQQLQRLENGGIIVSHLKGRTRLYQFNPRYFFLNELKALLQKAMNCLPREEIKKYYRMRTRPRRKGKPL